MNAVAIGLNLMMRRSIHYVCLVLPRDMYEAKTTLSN